MHLQPVEPQDLAGARRIRPARGQPQAALQELRAAIYLNPESVAPRRKSPRNGELLSIQNDYLQALRSEPIAVGRRR